MGKAQGHLGADDADLLPAGTDESDLGDADPIVDTRLADVMLLGSRRSTTRHGKGPRSWMQVGARRRLTTHLSVRGAVRHLDEATHRSDGTRSPSRRRTLCSSRAQSTVEIKVGTDPLAHPAHDPPGRSATKSSTAGAGP
ncbi:hypothetical protein GCM10025865_31040 [Paraoerskovia sediminicola]|uniref:Uncharacterized protein n=1 Tax=Paraoerskovia sediminicola TaxID=1138587 RepID=A0ABM8G6P2_9CELL|nr:hypothetical protein GCM10025865_31040 [Paraoerskovia sediminicola]